MSSIEPLAVPRPATFTSARLQRRLTALQARKRGGLVVYIMAADPDVETSMAILKGLPKMGVDVIELGLPFSDPMADGPVIQAASQRALKAGGSLVRTLEMVRLFRARDNVTPLVLMSYYNPIYVYGPQRFATAAAKVGIDGCIIIDLPPEEADELAEFLKAKSVDFILLATPTTDCMRLRYVLEKASGFLYYISIKGVTGTISATEKNICSSVLHLRKNTKLPIAVGFGINTPEQVAMVASIADAAVVGSAVVRRIAAGLDAKGHPRSGLVEEVLSFVEGLATAAHGC
ncbi:Tryptophan synthase alpha chain [invertebrate metagenome]|uniref:tryptophan synthase n=1 Tax=invertebrate metagenome TaxID=1711999 RepID=A0A484H5F2_9ZZZZ